MFRVPPVPYRPSVSVVDWNGDGDDDVMIPTNYPYFAFVERSYLDHGYANGQLLALQQIKRSLGGPQGRVQSQTSLGYR
jgi:hypothetical protein